jgi:hypothetical protein
MGVWFYQYCAAPSPPSINDVLAWMRQRNQPALISEENDISDYIDFESQNWEQLELVDPEGNLLILAHLSLANTENGVSDMDMLRQQAARLSDKAKCDQILEHLNRTNFVVATQLGLQTSYVDAQSAFRTYFIQEFDAMTYDDTLGDITLPEGTRINLGH